MRGGKRSAPLIASPPDVPVRAGYLDAFRGLAILLMIVDHVCVVFGFGEILRDTVTRAAMPMFFVLAGHLFSRLSGRHVQALGLGLALPVVVPWLDNPNVLVWWVLGSVTLAVARWGGLPMWLLVVVALGAYANGKGWELAHSYEPLALVALMAVGTLIPRSSFEWAGRMPAWISAIGRAPLRWYAGHLLALQAFVMLILWLY